MLRRYLQEVEQVDKISGIIPSSARVTNVDMKDSAPVRTSVPLFGRTEAPTRMGDSVSRLRPEDLVGGQVGWRAKDAKQAQIVNDVANSFFMKSKPQERTSSDVGSEEPLVQPDGLFPKGSFIDRDA